MHSRIFVLRNRNDIAADNYSSVYDEEELQKIISIADYVTLKKEAELEADIDWLAESYEINIKEEKFGLADSTKTFGIIYSSDIQKLIMSIKKVKQSCLDRVKKEIRKANPSLLSISCLAYPRDSFWFEIPEWGFSNEIDLLDYLEQKCPNEIIITESYDYHM